jgi:hypothetical protein
VYQHVKDGFEATVKSEMRPLETNMVNRKAIYENICKAFVVDPHLK